MTMLTSDISSTEQQQNVDCCSHAPSDLSGAAAGVHQHHGHHHHNNTASPAAGVEDSCQTACQDAAQLAKAKKQRRKQVDRACNNCRRSKTACSIERPCKRCCTHGLQDSCFDAPRKRRSKKNKLSPEDQYLWHEMGKFLAEEGSIAVGLPEGVTDAGIKKKKGRKPRKSLKLQKLQLQLAQQSQQYDQLNDSEDSSESIDILGGSEQYPSNNTNNNSSYNNNNNNGHTNFGESPYDPLQSADFFNESSPLQLLKSIDPNLDFNQFLSEICPGMSNFEFSPQQLQCLDLLSSDSSNDFFSSSPFSLPQSNSDDSSSQLSLQQSVSSLVLPTGQQQPGSQLGFSDSFSQLSSSFGSNSDSDDGFFGEDSSLSNYHDSVSLDLSSSSLASSNAGAQLSRFMPDSATCHSTISPAALSNSTWSPHHLHNQQHQFHHHHHDVLRVD